MSVGANNVSMPPIIRVMPLLPLPGAILKLSLASLESGRRSGRGERPRPQTRRCGGLLLPPLERNVDDGNDNDVAAGGTPAAIGTWAKVEAVDAPAIFSDAGARTVEQNLILFYPWCYYATQKYHDMRKGMSVHFDEMKMGVIFV
jgi:hypothetical protein